MKKARESVEWSYGTVKNMYAMASKKSQFMLEKSEPENVMAQIRVMHLLANCRVCLHGSNVVG
jgi:hypothetical protein